MYLRYLALAGVLVMATGCVEERVVHERRGPPPRAEYVEVIARRRRRNALLKKNRHRGPVTSGPAATGAGTATAMSRFMATGKPCGLAIVTSIRTGKTGATAGITMSGFG